MSSDMATANSSEFKVVQTKRSSHQGKIENCQFCSLNYCSFAGRRGVGRDRFSSDRYGYGGRGGIGSTRHGGGSGHTPSNEEPASSVTRKKTPLQHLHQKAGVSE